MKQNQISEEIAQNELFEFLNNWLEKPIKFEDVAEAYPNSLEALCSGRLVIDENKIPTYSFIEPIKNDKDEVSTSNVTFKTRISPLNQARLGKGLNVSTDQLHFLLVCVAYIIGKTVQEVDKLEKKDYNTVREIASVFI